MVAAAPRVSMGFVVAWKQPQADEVAEKPARQAKAPVPPPCKLIDFLGWGRRFRLPIAASNDFFRSLFSLQHRL